MRRTEDRESIRGCSVYISDPGNTQTVFTSSPPHFIVLDKPNHSIILVRPPQFSIHTISAFTFDLSLTPRCSSRISDITEIHSSVMWKLEAGYRHCQQTCQGISLC